MIFEFLRKKAENKKRLRFIWKDKNITLTPDPEYNIRESLTLTDEEKQEFTEQGENKAQ